MNGRSGCVEGPEGIGSHGKFHSPLESASVLTIPSGGGESGLMTAVVAGEGWASYGSRNEISIFDLWSRPWAGSRWERMVRTRRVPAWDNVSRGFAMLHGRVGGRLTYWCVMSKSDLVSVVSVLFTPWPLMIASCMYSILSLPRMSGSYIARVGRLLAVMTIICWVLGMVGMVVGKLVTGTQKAKEYRAQANETSKPVGVTANSEYHYCTGQGGSKNRE